MAEPHDRAARVIAKKLAGEYDPNSSPDVKGRLGAAEVKSYAHEVSEALRQLQGQRGPTYVVLPKPEHERALERLEGLKTGLMDYRGNIVKPSTRKR